MKTFLLCFITTLLLATQSISGTWNGVLNYPIGKCTYVPKNVACLSECAFNWIKGNPKHLDGLIGFHMPWSKRTGKVMHNYDRIIYSYMKKYGWEQWFVLVQKHTSPSKFLVFEKQTGVAKLMSTRTIRQRGYKIVDTSEILKCNSRTVRD